MDSRPLHPTDITYAEWSLLEPLLPAPRPGGKATGPPGTRDPQWYFPHPPGFSGKGYHHSSKTSRGEDLQIDHPVWCGYSPTFHFHATLVGMPGPTLLLHQIIQVCEPRQKRLLAPVWMM